MTDQLLENLPSAAEELVLKEKNEKEAKERAEKTEEVVEINKEG